MKLTDLQEVARIASSYFHHCVIGGGAPRDAFLGGPIKDIDLFVDTRGLDVQTYEELAYQFTKKLHGHAQPSDTASIEGPGTMHIDAAGIPQIELLPIERCAFTDVYDYDFGLSQILMTAKGTLRTEAFDSDVRANTITYMGDESWDAKGRERSAKRLLRIRKKYPSFFPVNCEVLGVGE